MPEPTVPLVRRERCSGCAFTPGTEAHQSEITSRKAKLCVDLGRYFFCHRNALDTGTIEKPEALCKGWLQAVSAKIEDGSIENLSAHDRAERELWLKCIEFAEGDDIEHADFTDEDFAILDEWRRLGVSGLPLEGER